MATNAYDSQDVSLPLSESTPNARESQDVSLSIFEASTTRAQESQDIILSVSQAGVLSTPLVRLSQDVILVLRPFNPGPAEVCVIS